MGPVTKSPAIGTRYSVRSTQYPRTFAVLFLLTFAGTCPADDEPPIVGQPQHFSGAVGRFHITTTAQPLQVQEEDALTYTVRITAEGDAREAPQRPRLAKFAVFTDAFYIEEIAPSAGAKPAKNTWEFAYRLKPKSTAVTAIPGFPFVFYRPGLVPPRRGYMTVFAPEIAITVTPRKEVWGGTTATRPIRGPDAAFALAGGDVLRRDSDDRLPGSFVLVLALLLPPAGCVAWYLVWRRVYPDVARLARRRRSRAAQEALRSLHHLGKRSDAEVQARRAAGAVAEYLRRRLELSVIEPTPKEAEVHLRRLGVSEKLAGQTADLLRSCAAVRFDPEPPPPTDLAEAATQLILALEAETWSE
jgi:hypothetical protein